jgi:hypothetical protein
MGTLVSAYHLLLIEAGAASFKVLEALALRALAGVERNIPAILGRILACLLLAGPFFNSHD